jgi:Protein of unknown function (DUF3631)
MTLPPPKVCDLIRKLFAQMGSSGKDAEVAREKLTQLLVEHGLSWNDLPAILAATAAPNTSHGMNGGAPASGMAVGPKVNVLDLVAVLIEDHVAMTDAECTTAALWVLHTWVFDRFPITPRLALLSPVRGCGKTTMMVLLELLVAEPYRTDNVTAAAIYHRLDRRPRTTLLVDEADNLGLFRNDVLRSVFNSGHRRGGGIDRLVGGQPRKFRVFAPLAVASIGSLPLPLLHRSAVINMQRSGKNGVKRLDESDPAFGAARDEIRKWAATCSLAPEPEMPGALRDRAADNWRVLLAIADDLGRGEAARAAAVALCGNRPDEDSGVTLLGDIRTVFQARGVDRITSLALIEALLGLEDNFWNEWSGPHDDQSPRKLTQNELSRLLRPFGIRPKTVWPARRRLGDKSGRGYFRSQFEQAWRAYCPSADTPAQPSKIIELCGP